ncbi:hypothetical protein BD626DRAFT_158836 [Schizophyllum amplum]|uniref:Uncharacterized protein n=1 Tax=Schizophyllum amplum TaxID=97359 RepID=A0A550BRI4_9AGAR|nr:hypothetical protein BD626DRAFT_158836 [Auriculariopsis ampla]
MGGITVPPYRSRRWKSSACRTRPLRVLFRHRLPLSDARSSPPTLRCVANKGVFVMWRRFCLPTCISTLQASNRASAPSLTRLPADDTALTLLLPEVRPDIRMMTRWPPDTARGRGSAIPLHGCSALPHLPSESSEFSLSDTGSWALTYPIKMMET